VPSVGPSRPFGNAGAPYRASGQNVQGNGGKFKPLHPQNTMPFGAPNSGTYRPQMQGGLGKRGAFFANNTNRPKAANAYQHDGMLNGDVFVAKCNNEYDDVYDNDNCDYDECLISDSVYGDSEFIVPVFVNGIKCKALRDSGNFGPVIVDESLVPKDDINYRKTVDCTGTFDGGRSKSIPTAKIKLSSPWFNTSGKIHITAAVTKLPQ